MITQICNLPNVNEIGSQKGAWLPRLRLGKFYLMHAEKYATQICQEKFFKLI